MDAECRRIREILSDIYDENLEMQEEVQTHMNSCPACMEYREALFSMGTSIAGEIDNKLKSMPPPDFEAIYRKSGYYRYKRNIPVIWGIAAVLVLSLGIFFSTLYFSHQQKAVYITMDVKMFVSDIFSQPILYNEAGLNDVTGGLKDVTGEQWWFDEDLSGQETLFENAFDLETYFTE